MMKEQSLRAVTKSFHLIHRHEAERYALKRGKTKKPPKQTNKQTDNPKQTNKKQTVIILFVQLHDRRIL